MTRIFENSLFTDNNLDLREFGFKAKFCRIKIDKKINNYIVF